MTGALISIGCALAALLASCLQYLGKRGSGGTATWVEGCACCAVGCEDVDGLVCLVCGH